MRVEEGSRVLSLLRPSTPCRYNYQESAPTRRCGSQICSQTQTFYARSMDPVTAFGLAAGVAQFVTIASQLIATTKEVHESATGQTKRAATLETVYSQLQDLSSRLVTPPRRNAGVECSQSTPDLEREAFAIQQLSMACQCDCQRLLEILCKLKDDSSRQWQSFRVALKTVWKDNEIADLEKRLHYTQTTLTLRVCTLTRYAKSAATTCF
jgi:hypothetical protein